MLPLENGGALQAKRGDGTRIEFKFGDAERLAGQAEIFEGSQAGRLSEDYR
jgi:hypothetical protein